MYIAGRERVKCLSVVQHTLRQQNSEQWKDIIRSTQYAPVALDLPNIESDWLVCQCTDSYQLTIDLLISQLVVAGTHPGFNISFLTKDHYLVCESINETLCNISMRLSPRVILSCIGQVLTGIIAYSHLGIVHNDLYLESIGISPNSTSDDYYYDLGITSGVSRGDKQSLILRNEGYDFRIIDFSKAMRVTEDITGLPISDSRYSQPAPFLREHISYYPYFPVFARDIYSFLLSMHKITAGPAYMQIHQWIRRWILRIHAQASLITSPGVLSYIILQCIESFKILLPYDQIAADQMQVCLVNRGECAIDTDAVSCINGYKSSLSSLSSSSSLSSTSPTTSPSLSFTDYQICNTNYNHEPPSPLILGAGGL